jgi:hypothetical protein
MERGRSAMAGEAAAIMVQSGPLRRLLSAGEADALCLASSFFSFVTRRTLRFS